MKLRADQLHQKLWTDAARASGGHGDVVGRPPDTNAVNQHVLHANEDENFCIGSQSRMDSDVTREAWTSMNELAPFLVLRIVNTSARETFLEDHA